MDVGAEPRSYINNNVTFKEIKSFLSVDVGALLNHSNFLYDLSLMCLVYIWFECFCLYTQNWYATFENNIGK